MDKNPLSAEEAAKIANVAWAQDAKWGTFVWLTFTTGARRGELVGLAWEHVDLTSGLLTIRRSLVRHNGKTILNDTKTHQTPVIKLDQDTISILTEPTTAQSPTPTSSPGIDTTPPGASEPGPPARCPSSLLAATNVLRRRHPIS